VVELTEAGIRVLRPGAVDDAALRRALTGEGAGMPGDPGRSRSG
jgi:hypothetical protein